MIHRPVADGQHVNHFVRFVDFINCAVDAMLISIEQMAKGPLRRSPFRCNGAAPGKSRKGVDGLLQAVEPPGAAKDSAALISA